MEQTKNEGLTLDEAAVRAGVAKRRIKSALEAGELPTVALPKAPGRRGPSPRGVRQTDVDAWAAERQPQSEVLTPEAAAERAGVALWILQAAVDAGDLPTTMLPKPRGRRGAAPRGVQRRHLDAWSATQHAQNKPPVPPHLHDLRVSLPTAGRLTGYSKTHLLKAITKGNLRAISLNPGAERAQWQVRLADLANWYARPERWDRRGGPRQFDPEILGKLEAIVAGDEPPGNDSGPTR